MFVWNGFRRWINHTLNKVLKMSSLCTKWRMWEYMWKKRSLPFCRVLKSFWQCKKPCAPLQYFVAWECLCEGLTKYCAIFLQAVWRLHLEWTTCETGESRDQGGEHLDYGNEVAYIHKWWEIRCYSGTYRKFLLFLPGLV